MNATTKIISYDDSRPLNYSRSQPSVLTQKEMEAISAFSSVQVVTVEGEEFARIAGRTTYRKDFVMEAGTSVWIKCD